MNATIPISASKPAASVKRGIAGLHCIKCDAEGVHVNLHDTVRFHCTECSEDFAAADVIVRIHAWRKCLEWLATCPETK